MQDAVPQPRFATALLATGVRLQYAEQGDPGGDVLVFLHGYVDSWFSFSRLLPLLPTRYHAYAVDQRGHGDSERPTGGYAMDDLAADAVAFLDAVDASRATLIGHSMGGFVARRVAERHPERVAGLVLIGSAVSPVTEGVLKLREAVQALPDPVPPDFVRAFQAGPVPLPEPFFEGVVAASRAVPAHVWRSALDGVLGTNDAVELGRIAAPTLLLSGEGHAYFGRVEQERLAAAIPGATLMLYPETGTAPHWERPERVAADLEAFLRAIEPVTDRQGRAMDPKIAFMGGGAIGSYLGAFLTRAGYRPTIIDPWPANVEAMRGKGITVSGGGEEFTVKVDALHLCEVQSIRTPFDIVFIAMKSYDTEWAATLMRGYLAPTGCMVSAQNGINDETIARIVGFERAVGCTISTITVGLDQPGHVVRGGRSGRERGYAIFRVGELSGVLSPRVERIAAMLDCVDAARTTTNIWGERWAKLAANSMGNTLTAMSGLGPAALADVTPRFALLRDQVAREVVLVGRALGVSVESIGGRPADAWIEDAGMQSADPPPATTTLRPAASGDGGGWQASTSQDIAKGRRTEIDYLNGYVAARGREVGVPTPVNDAIVTVFKEVESGVLAPDPANVDRVWDLSHEAVRV